MPKYREVMRATVITGPFEATTLKDAVPLLDAQSWDEARAEIHESDYEVWDEETASWQTTFLGDDEDEGDE